MILFARGDTASKVVRIKPGHFPAYPAPLPWQLADAGDDDGVVEIISILGWRRTLILRSLNSFRPQEWPIAITADGPRRYCLKARDKALDADAVHWTANARSHIRRHRLDSAGLTKLRRSCLPSHNEFASRKRRNEFCQL